jgi:hypothetical protein
MTFYIEILSSPPSRIAGAALSGNAGALYGMPLHPREFGVDLHGERDTPPFAA